MALLLKDLVTVMAAAIAADQDIVATCQDLYARAPTVHVGAAGYQAAGPEDYPAFTVLGLSKDRSEDPGRNRWTYDVTLGLALHDETVSTETTPDGAEVKTYRGAATLEDLLELALAAARGISEELVYDQVITDIEPLEFFPLFVGEVSLSVGFEVFLGGPEPII